MYRPQSKSLSLLNALIKPVESITRFVCIFISRTHYEKLYADVQRDMLWVMSALHPDLLLVQSGERQRLTCNHTTVVLQAEFHSVKIIREWYRGGSSLLIMIASACSPTQYFRIDIVLKVLAKMGDCGLRPDWQQWLSTSSLIDLDASIKALDDSLQRCLSSSNYEQFADEMAVTREKLPP